QPNFHASDPNDDLRWYAEVTSSQDGYAALLSWAEIQPLVNNVQMLLSLIETPLPSPPGVATPQNQGPRLTTPGDVRGGRYVSGTGVITVLRAPDVVPTSGTRANLSGQNLSGQSLQNAFLVAASRNGANLSVAQAQGAFLNGANLTGANLSGAQLNNAVLIGANLTGAN